MAFQPRPVDTSNVELSSDIQALTEDLAQHAHAIWAQQRITDGWNWGPNRNDDRKEHPCLIPYEELDDSERQYDRNAALETLKVISAMGYRIVPPATQQSRVVVFSGHMIDHPDRPSARFPEHLQGAVKETLRDWAKSASQLVGYSSAACGADILFQEIIQELNGESHIVLPYPQDQFAIDSVNFADADWRQRFANVLDGAAQVVVASPQRPVGKQDMYDYTNLVMHGLASVRAAEIHIDLKPNGLVVWDGKSGDGQGGTASVVRHLRKLGVTVDQVDVSGLAANGSGRLPVIRNPTVPNPREN